MPSLRIARSGDQGYHQATNTTTEVAPSTRTKRVSMMLQNVSGVDVFVGLSTPVTTSDDANGGIKLPAGGVLNLENYSGTVYVIVATGTASLRYFEYFE